MPETRNPNRNDIKKQKKFRWSSFFKWFGIIVGVLLILGVITFFVVKNRLEVSLPSINDIAENPPVASQIFDRHGRFIASVQLDEYRISVPISEISPYIQKAVVASEDERFYRHVGFDLIGIARAFYYNMKEGGIGQGGSTITQQLARDLFLSLETSYIRKIKEILLALELEKKYTKDEILESFLNYQYFGPSPSGRCFGVETVARNFFGKHNRDVTLAEAAIIAGTLDAPSLRSPWYDPENAMNRGNLVLEKMLRNGFITEEEYNTAYIQGIQQDIPKASQKTPGIVYLGSFSAETKTESKYYFVDYIREEVQKLFPEGEKALLHDGLKIYTTLDIRVQDIADVAMEKIFSEAEKSGQFNPNLKDVFNVVQPQGQIVVLKPKTGEILAMVGGRDYANTKFNRCTALRQPGSLFKIFDYTTAIESGVSGTGTIITSESFKMQDNDSVWVPEEWTSGDTFFGPLTARMALIKSSNICAIRVAQWSGWSRVAYYAEKMGIQRSVLPVPSMAIGSLEVSPIEMATAFGVLANEGLRTDPISITKITTHNDRTLFAYERFPIRVIHESSSILMNDLFQSVFHNTAGATVPFDAAGKTGTAEDFLSGWFTGYTPNIVACAWVGRDSAEVKVPNARIWGSSFAAPIVKEFLNQLYKAQSSPNWDSTIYIEKTPFKNTNDDIVGAMLCKTTGLLANNFCPEELRVESRYRQGYLPSYYCNVHQEQFVVANVCPLSGKLAGEWCKNPIEKRFLKGTEPKDICDVCKVPIELEMLSGILDDDKSYQVGKPVEMHFKINNELGNRIEIYINNRREAILSEEPWFYEWIPEQVGENQIIVILRDQETFLYQLNVNVDIPE
jgi:penicillin-binding protein 1A